MQIYQLHNGGTPLGSCLLPSGAAAYAEAQRRSIEDGLPIEKAAFETDDTILSPCWLTLEQPSDNELDD